MHTHGYEHMVYFEYEIMYFPVARFANGLPCQEFADITHFVGIPPPPLGSGNKSTSFRSRSAPLSQ